MDDKQPEKLKLPTTKREEAEARRNATPKFAKETIAHTANDMFPGCQVLWSKTNGKKHKMTILLGGKEDSNMLVPFSMTGTFEQIARTLVTIFGCCQHRTMMMMQQEFQKQEHEKKTEVVAPQAAVEKPNSGLVVPGA